MTATATATVPCPEQVYSDLKNLIHHLVYKFHQRYGGDWDELVSEANLHFARACRTYDPRKAKLITHVYTRIYYGLLNTLGRKGFIIYGPRLERKDVPLEELPARAVLSGLPRLLKEVSGDAQVAIRLAMAVSHRAPHAAKRRKVISTLKEAGWSMTQILKAFAEVREALAG